MIAHGITFAGRSRLILLLLHCASVLRVVECHRGVLVLDLPGHRCARWTCSLQQGLHSLARLQTLRHARGVNAAGVSACEPTSAAQVIVAALSVSHGPKRARRRVELHLRRRSLVLRLVCSDLLRRQWLLLLLLLFLLLPGLSVDLSRRLHEVLHLGSSHIRTSLIKVLPRAPDRDLLRHHHQILLLKVLLA